MHMTAAKFWHPERALSASGRRKEAFVLSMLCYHIAPLTDETIQINVIF